MKTTTNTNTSISPISEKDIKIISELIVALNTCNQDLLAEILKKYKKIPDDQIYKLLVQFNVDYEPIFKPEEGEVDRTRKFIKIKDVSFEVKFIMSITPVEVWNNEKEKNEYILIINEDIANKVYYSNTIIKFESEEQRRIELATVKKKLEYCNVVFI